MSEQTALTPYQRWFEANRDKLKNKRNTKYAVDAEYRKKCKLASQAYREAKRRPIKLPDGYTLNHAEVAEACGVTAHYLRTLRSKEYYPEPYSSGGRLYYKAEQVELLKKLVEFFKKKVIRRHSAALKQELDTLVEWVYSNW